MGIKKEHTNKTKERRLFQPHNLSHCPVFHTSAMVAKKNVMTKPPAIIPKNVPQKYCGNDTRVRAIPKFIGVKGKKTRRRYSVTAKPFSATLSSYFARRFPINDAAKSRPR